MSTQAKLLQPPQPVLTGSDRVESPVFRFVERLAAGAALCAAAPVLAPAALLVTAFSRRSPLIAHLRVGRNGEPFWLLKLRTMWGGATQSPRRFPFIEFIHDDEGPRRKSVADPRVTSRLARFLRRMSIDELPQLVHVLTGRMSFVGPRPLTRSELDRHYGNSADEMLLVRPGLTGLWQVMGRNKLTYRQRRRLDLFYVKRRSQALDLMILARTVPQVLTGRDCW